MATRLFLQKHDNQKLVDRQEVTVPNCPMFDHRDENNTSEFRALLAQGYRVTGHVDQREGSADLFSRRSPVKS